MAERFKFQPPVGRLVSGSEVGREALLAMPEFLYWKSQQPAPETMGLNGGPANPERIRVGSKVDGEGYGVSKVTKIQVDGRMVRVWIAYGAKFENGALLYDDKYPRRIRE